MIDLQQIKLFAIEAHANVNHLYDKKPYTVHLIRVVHYADKFMYLNKTCQPSDIIAACWLHDTIEDCRLTYNDVLARTNTTIADIVYACTNEKGKTREERAGEKYYEGIRKTPGAIFVKLCDRLANIRYGIENKSRMINVYQKEHEKFIRQLFIDDDFAKNYAEMILEMNMLFKVVN